ncbi:hypothetical protein DFH08DRAFT_946008 [Mycena albidolilacea]|uniref:Uncharacterized protein n=1 Tax=Mycena albidolilacea TaxID=1033008 RepID=A0AAD6YYB7_9AGAR|nr:hypothetical protein DFH08DRAFT_946008 [Mycena albidolilacea]
MYKMEGLDASDRRFVQMAMVSKVMTSSEIENVEGLLSIEVGVIVQKHGYGDEFRAVSKENPKCHRLAFAREDDSYPREHLDANQDVKSNLDGHVHEWGNWNSSLSPNIAVESARTGSSGAPRRRQLRARTGCGPCTVTRRRTRQLVTENNGPPRGEFQGDVWWMCASKNLNFEEILESVHCLKTLAQKLSKDPARLLANPQAVLTLATSSCRLLSSMFPRAPLAWTVYGTVTESRNPAGNST